MQKYLRYTKQLTMAKSLKDGDMITEDEYNAFIEKLKLEYASVLQVA